MDSRLRGNDGFHNHLINHFPSPSRRRGSIEQQILHKCYFTNLPNQFDFLIVSDLAVGLPEGPDDAGADAEIG